MDYSVCEDEADNWRKCTEKNLGSSDLDQICTKELSSFDQCIAAWRSGVGHSVRIKGENEGEPPPQCAAMSCLIGLCLRNNGYNFEGCKIPMQYFKHCVKSLYGSEYVT
ncbi:hypothetical protein DQ04_00321260 [Trypanosoma grayi]|uniref:hypothetical protein n=1 Tax=Trypanosoma grayi TaxID=71804 RepID=UPI0004F3FF90|nr:hypothetical protein DQ04_00321260 [Trypanosoma grayi]KEG14757.1 hypothetical protein DQ04_00321260 [Trypanosoma grayi]